MRRTGVNPRTATWLLLSSIALLLSRCRVDGASGEETTPFFSSTTEDHPDTSTPNLHHQEEVVSPTKNDLGHLESCPCEEEDDPPPPPDCRRVLLSAASCPCLAVCAGQSGQACSVRRPCDEEFGLRCDPRHNDTCAGPLLIKIYDVTHHSAKITWGMSLSELQPQALVSYAAVYKGIHTQWTRVGDTKPFILLDNLVPNHNYFLKVEEDGKQEISAFRTKENVSIPKILVKQKSQTSLTIVWDDFRLPGYVSEYILEYRVHTTTSHHNWTQVQAGTQTLLTLTRLMPGTPYQVKVSVRGEEEDKELLDLHQSEVITVSTEDGCVVRGDHLYAVGDVFFVDCDLRCVCTGGRNTTNCFPRCDLPLLKINSSTTDDPRCHQKIVPSDPCCIILHCAESKAVEDSMGENKQKKKSGECPLLPNSSSCLSDCDHDSDCSGDFKCCPSACGGAVCVSPLLSEDVCQHVYCGPNAECVSSQKACICTEGYQGDPHDVLAGCIAVNSSSEEEEERATRVEEGSITPGYDFRNELAGDDSRSVALTATDTPFKFDLRPIPTSTSSSNGSVVSVLFDGCQYDNVTYDQGMRFEDGCDALCICEGAGHITCTPRCNNLSLEGEGPACKEVLDPNDHCCKIMVCNLPGENEDETEQPLEGLPLRIVSALALNSTSVRIRIASTLHPSTTLEVWFSSPSDNPMQWQKSTPHLHPTEIHRGMFELDIGRLSPQTNYAFRVGSGVDHPVSNTVHIKTFPAGVRSSAEVCIHHNRTYSVGETFDSGCEHRCVCRERGYIECRDRCALYVDAIGYEGCEWTESEEDPCCLVPFCHDRNKMNRQPSGGDAFCMSSGEVYRVGDIWETGDGCRTSICRCARIPNGSTTVQCQSECPPLPPNAHIPTAQCPTPVLLLKPKDGPCTCPRLQCSPQQQQNKPSQVGKEPKEWCDFKGKRYLLGHEFHDGCLAMCRCMPDLRVECAAIECPYHFGADFSECLEWDIDPDFFPVPPHCCAPAKCKNDGSCMFAGIQFRNFEDIPSENLPCGARCVCINGNVTCENRCPPLEDTPPFHLPCPPERAHKHRIPGDACCLRWACVEKMEEPSKGVLGRDDEIPQQQLHKVSVSALNSTAVRVRFSLSDLLVGLVGHAELHFTTDPHLPAGQWHVQKFSRPKRLFDSPNIEYVLNALRPNTTYFLRLRIQIDALQGANLESRLFKLKMPPAEGVDDYYAQVSVEENDVGPDRTDFQLSGIPEPIPRYVHVIKIMYRLSDGEEQHYSFKVPNDTRRVTLDHLKPGKRYLAQLELYLTDGRTLTSNEVEFITPEGEVHNPSENNVIGAPSGASSNEAELLSSSSRIDEDQQHYHQHAYFVALVVVAVVAAVAGFGFVLLLIVLVRRQASAKAPISRTPSESAYDNPTYKTYDGERPEDKNNMQTTQA